MAQTFARVVSKEGAWSLTRSVIYGGLGLGLYEPSKSFCKLAFESTNIFMQIGYGAFATLLTNCMEVLKAQTFARVVSKEGAWSLTRSVIYGGLGLGLYEPSKSFCKLAFESTNIFMQIGYGAFATLLTNCMEVLKVNLYMR
ncbi:substrate carrier protein [Tanacetum coccineum]